MNKRKLGSDFEKRAGAFLKEKGYEIIEYNFRSRYGEIDIVARDGQYICFVEVKYRKTEISGRAVEAVDYRKQKTIAMVANYYIIKRRLSEWTPMRFDVVAIDREQIELIKNAWEL